MESNYTEEEIEQLKQSPYIMNATKKQIAYGDIFYQEFWRLDQRGFETAEIFSILGVDPGIVGPTRMRKVAYSARQWAEKGGLTKAVAEKPVSIAEQLNQQNRQIEFLKQENEFLKKKKLIDLKYKK